MPEKSLTIAAYAAGASLAAATLVYVFGPTFFLDEVDASSQNDRKRIAIGLTNVANDCFINSTLQALAGLPVLRLYLIRELHQRQLGGKDVYLDLGKSKDDEDKAQESKPDWLRLSLQTGLLTAALKDMLDALNERPISRKTISPQTFITSMEHAFKTRISRQQQDAQELLHLLLERLADEHYAGVRARKRAGAKPRLTVHLEMKQDINEVMEKLDTNEDHEKLNIDEKGNALDASNDIASRKLEDSGSSEEPSKGATVEEKDEHEQAEHDLPFEGKISSQLECSTCHFKPKAATTSFVTLTLNVPHDYSSTSLDACLDGMLKIEHIDDFRCDRCRLEHAISLVDKQLSRTSLPEQQREAFEHDRTRIEDAMKTDPEHPPEDLSLPDPASAPKRRITRFMRISTFPTVLAIHLSRSVWDGYSSSSKNTAKVSFPEILLLGSLVDRKKYRLLSVVTHKGGHNSGHYETFRRQWIAPLAVNDEKAASKDDLGSPTPLGSPRISLADRAAGSEAREDSADPVVDADNTTSTPSHAKTHSTGVAGTRFMAPSPRLKAASQAKIADRKRKAQDRWWRISDEKVKECKLNDVLGMQKEIYLLFYELVFT